MVYNWLVKLPFVVGLAYARSNLLFRPRRDSIKTRHNQKPAHSKSVAHCGAVVDVECRRRRGVEEEADDDDGVTVKVEDDDADGEAEVDD